MRLACVLVLAAVLGGVTVQIVGRAYKGPVKHRDSKSYSLTWPMQVPLSARGPLVAHSLALFAIGAGLAVIHPKKWWLIGPSTMALFPVLILIEIIRDSTCHNLWPFAILFLLILSIPAILGSFVGFVLRRGRN